MQKWVFSHDKKSGRLLIYFTLDKVINTYKMKSMHRGEVRVQIIQFNWTPHR